MCILGYVLLVIEDALKVAPGVFVRNRIPNEVLDGIYFLVDEVFLVDMLRTEALIIDTIITGLVRDEILCTA